MRSLHLRFPHAAAAVLYPASSTLTGTVRLSVHPRPASPRFLSRQWRPRGTVREGNVTRRVRSPPFRCQTQARIWTDFFLIGYSLYSRLSIQFMYVKGKKKSISLCSMKCSDEPSVNNMLICTTYMQNLFDHLHHNLLYSGVNL